jgi:hypothetical protein
VCRDTASLQPPSQGTQRRQSMDDRFYRWKPRGGNLILQRVPFYIPCQVTPRSRERMCSHPTFCDINFCIYHVLHAEFYGNSLPPHQVTQLIQGEHETSNMPLVIKKQVPPVGISDTLNNGKETRCPARVNMKQKSHLKTENMSSTSKSKARSRL